MSIRTASAAFAVLFLCSCSSASKTQESRLLRRIGSIQGWTFVRTQPWRDEGGPSTQGLYRVKGELSDSTRKLCEGLLAGRLGNLPVQRIDESIDSCIKPASIYIDPAEKESNCTISALVGFPGLEPNSIDERGLIVDVNC
jgi:hypothetical protein